MNETTREFRDRLFALCREYNVEMEVIEDLSARHVAAEGVNFFSYDEWEDGEIVRPGVDLDLGTKEFFTE